MKKILFTVLSIVAFILSIQTATAQKTKYIFHDTLRNEISFSEFLGIRVTGTYTQYEEPDGIGRYKIYWKKSTDEEMERRLHEVLKATNITDSIDKVFPDMSFVDLNGRNYSTNSLKGKIVLINFWFVGCDNCEVERSSLNNLYKKYQDNDNVQFISFSKSRQGRTEKYLAKHNFEWPVVLFDRTLREKLTIAGYPTNIILNSDNKYQMVLQGLSEGMFLAINEELVKLLNSLPVLF